MNFSGKWGALSIVYMLIVYMPINCINMGMNQSFVECIENANRNSAVMLKILSSSLVHNNKGTSAL